MASWMINANSQRCKREENQDNYLIIEPDGQYRFLINETEYTASLSNWPIAHSRVAILDGMGGHENGRIFTETAIRQLLKIPFQAGIETMHVAVTTLHERLFQEFHHNKYSPGSTLIWVDIDPYGRATLVNIGDSRAYFRMPDDKLLPITRDHTLDEMALRDGLITEKEYTEITKDGKGQIAQALGYGSIRLKSHSDIEGIHCKVRNDNLLLNTHGKYSDFHKLFIRTDITLLLQTDGAYHFDDSDNATTVELFIK